MRRSRKVTRALLITAVTVLPVAGMTGAVTVSNAAAGAVYYVSPSGNDSEAGRQPAPWAC